MEITNEIAEFLTSFNVIIIVTELFYCFKLKRRSHFAGRLMMPVLFCVMLGKNRISEGLGTIILMRFLYTIPFLNMYYIIMLLVSVGILYFCFDEKPMRLTFYVVSSFIIEHFCSHAMQLFTYAIQGHHYTFPLVSRAFELLVLFILLTSIHLIWKERFMEEGVELSNKSTLFFVSVAMMLVSVFSSIIYFLDYVTPATHIYELFICLLLIVIQYGFLSISEKDMEKAVIEQVISDRTKQQLMYSDNMKYINMKCHDLKNHIQVLKAVQTDEERRRNIEELEQAVLLQSTKIDTGNEVLDVVLMEKHLICQKKHISLGCMADGKVCSFMEPSDICMLFGNALNNAIEAAEGCEADKRQISLRVWRENNFVRINVENYFAGQLATSNGVLNTTKDNTMFEHGYGVKSMEAIAKKYGGNLTFSANEDVFIVYVLFPIESE